MNKELKKQFENIINNYLKVQENKSSLVKDMKNTEKKSNWKKYQEQNNEL